MLLELSSCRGMNVSTATPGRSPGGWAPSARPAVLLDACGQVEVASQRSDVTSVVIRDITPRRTAAGSARLRTSRAWSQLAEDLLPVDPFPGCVY